MEPKKIHHKTLEAQKRREAAEQAAATQASTAMPETIIPENQIPENQMIQVPKDFIEQQQAIMAQQAALIESLSNRVASVEDQAAGEKNKSTAPLIKKEYMGPRQVSYYLYTRTTENWVERIPIVDYTSMKIDNARSGLHYKNQYGVVVDNQIVVLTLADGTKEKVEPLYLAECEVSEMEYPKFLENASGDKVKWNTSAAYTKVFKDVAFYYFDTPEYGEIKIPMKLITSSKSSNYKPWLNILDNGK